MRATHWPPIPARFQCVRRIGQHHRRPLPRALGVLAFPWVVVSIFVVVSCVAASRSHQTHQGRILGIFPSRACKSVSMFCLSVRTQDLVDGGRCAAAIAGLTSLAAGKYPVALSALTPIFGRWARNEKLCGGAAGECFMRIAPHPPRPGECV